ncbi:MAG: hypothetical protein US89_C0002G0006 [Candidatus Peregrinibacteria bacterium GW2011_GWF2_38_29]|nr:MAG: hypothetical protein US89_C0002G0006 [Candidatus Peregrinibacteria bacterium GW2011_GWF2_38_29]HBB02162.1 hypothetical protein [Candidatus Peregrinibacteria bacterium]
MTILDTIPAFPKTRKINISDFALYEKWRKENGSEMADTIFANLFIWSDSRPILFSKIDNALIIAGIYDGQKKFIYPIGKFDYENMIEKLIKISPNIIKIPERAAEKLQQLGFKIEEDRDNFEYVYKYEDLAELKGRRYDGKRHNIKTCLSKYECIYEKLSHNNCEDCLKFHEKWAATKPDQKKETQDEHLAVKKSLQYFNELELIGGAIRINRQIEAFTIGGKINEKTAIIHSEKANAKIPGLYQVINQWFLINSLNNAGIEFVNREQDLGIPGLRKAKLGYHPDHFIKKFCKN